MAAKTQIVHEGKIYYSVSATARLLGTTTTKLKQIIAVEGFEWQNFRVNGPIWIGAESINSYMRRKKA